MEEKELEGLPRKPKHKMDQRGDIVVGIMGIIIGTFVICLLFYGMPKRKDAKKDTSSVMNVYKLVIVRDSVHVYGYDDKDSLEYMKSYPVEKGVSQTVVLSINVSK